MTIVDLTRPFTAHMPSYPGDPIPTLTQRGAVATHGCTDHFLQTSMHVGTHIDAPMHMIEGGKRISDIPAHRFVGRGHVIDVRGLQQIDETSIADNDIQRGDIVLFCTGIGEQFGTDAYYAAHPTLTPALAETLVKKGISIVGLDTPSPDTAPFPVHKILLGNDILIIENLTNLESLLSYDHFTIYALPMKIEADAAPVRVIASIG